MFIYEYCVGLQSEAESAVRKARLLQTQRREEYEKARGSLSRTGEEQTHTGGRTQERKRKVEEEALQKVQLNKHTIDCAVLCIMYTVVILKLCVAQYV